MPAGDVIDLDDIQPDQMQHLNTGNNPNVMASAMREAGDSRYQAPTEPTRDPRIRSSAPTVSTQDPRIRSSAPTVPTQDPRIRSSTPTVFTRDPRIRSSTPTVLTQDPSIRSSAPAHNADLTGSVAGFENIAAPSDRDMAVPAVGQAEPSVLPSHDLDHSVVGRGPSSVVKRGQAGRQTYRDIRGILREIWQPDDVDGLQNGEIPHTLNHLERFRFFQHDIGPIIRKDNSPPRHVILDDKACYDILQSKAYTAKERGKYWIHDFATGGNIRIGRINRGRAALVSVADGGELISRGDVIGPQEVGWAFMGDKKNGKKYHFTGERNGYRGVRFGEHEVNSSSESESQREEGSAVFEVDDQAEDNGKGKGKANALSREELNLLYNPPRKHRHHRPRLNPFLRPTPSPPWPGRDRRERLLGNQAPYSGPSYVESRGSQSAYEGLSGHSNLAGNPSDRAKGKRRANEAFIDDSSSDTPQSAERPSDHGARSVYAGMSYGYQDEYNFPATFSMGNTNSKGEAAPQRYEDMGNVFDDEQSSIWQSVKKMEMDVADMKRQLAEKDRQLTISNKEIEQLRRENGRWREMDVDRLKNKDKPVFIDLRDVSDDEEGRDEDKDDDVEVLEGLGGAQ